MSVSGSRPAYAAGVRAAVATVFPLAAAQLLGLGGAGTWLSFGGFNGALSDRGGSYRMRASVMAGVTAAGAFSAGAGALAAGRAAVAIPLVFGVAFVASLLRVYGASGTSVGGAMLTVLVVSIAFPAASLAEALHRAGYVLVGGSWALFVALVLWPLRPYRPARVAVAAVYRELATYADRIAARVRSSAGEETPPSGVPVRLALEGARAVLVDLQRGRPGRVERGERLLVLAVAGDQMFGHLVALGESLSSRAPRGEAALREVVSGAAGEAAQLQRQVAAALERESGGADAAVSWSGDAVRRLAGATEAEHVAIVLDRLAQFATTAVVAVESLNGAGGRGARYATSDDLRRVITEEVESPRESAWAPLRALFARESLLMGFALRVALVTAAATAAVDVLDLPRGYWVTITVIVILQPYTGVTLTRAVQRVIGTVAGAALAAVLALAFHDPRAILAIAFLFVALCVALLPVNYAAFSVFLTPTFVLLAEVGAGDWRLAPVRVLDTLLGGALALLGARWLWPRPERERFPQVAAVLLRAAAHYLAAVVDRFADRGEAAHHALRHARRAVGVATVNAEESVQRVYDEAHGRSERVGAALVIVNYGRRLTSTIAALSLARHATGPETAAQIVPLAEPLVRRLGALAAALERGERTGGGGEAAPGALAPLPPVVRALVERVTVQIDALHDAVGDLAGERAEGELSGRAPP